MKVAVISDIHGNMQALESVLSDIEHEKCDKILCLGDLAMAGPEPVKAIEAIKKLYDNGKLELIKGNTDVMIANYDDFGSLVKSKFPIMGNALEDDVKIVSDELKVFLDSLPEQKTLEIEGVKILMVHGSPRKIDENIFPDMPILEIEEMLSGVDADLVLCGHSHIPCGYQTSRKQTVVNDGSVGRPFTQNTQSCYVIANFSDGNFDIMHKFVDYDKVKAAKILAERSFEGARKLSQILLNPEERHM